jgi:hypothetical protein
MARMLVGFEVDNFDEWKEVFDSDPGNRRSVAKGHRIYRSIDNPTEIYLSVDYPSADDARTVLERLRESGVLERFTPTQGPTIVEVVEETNY